MIILMGVAGSGKSMQGRLLADEKGYSWISTGEILRVLVTGKRRQEMLKGKLLTDAEMVHVISTVFDLIDPKQEFVLDGFPRTLPQADWLIAQSNVGKFPITSVVHLKADEQVVLSRLKKRGRADDTEAAIQSRFAEYNAVTLPIIERFKRENIAVHEVTADQPPETVHAQIVALLEKK